MWPPSCCCCCCSCYLRPCHSRGFGSRSCCSPPSPASALRPGRWNQLGSSAQEETCPVEVEEVVALETFIRGFHFCNNRHIGSSVTFKSWTHFYVYSFDLKQSWALVMSQGTYQQITSSGLHDIHLNVFCTAQEYSGYSIYFNIQWGLVCLTYQREAGWERWPLTSEAELSWRWGGTAAWTLLLCEQQHLEPRYSLPVSPVCFSRASRIHRKNPTLMDSVGSITGPRSQGFVGTNCLSNEPCVYKWENILLPLRRVSYL